MLQQTHYPNGVLIKLRHFCIFITAVAVSGVKYNTEIVFLILHCVLLDAVKKPWERSNSTDKSSLVSRSVTEGSLTSNRFSVDVDFSSGSFRVRPVGTGEGDTEFDKMKQVVVKSRRVFTSLSEHVRVNTLFTENICFVNLQEILDEVVRELHKVKDEIINGEAFCFSFY